MTLAEKLRELRAVKGLTQEAVAEHLSVSAQTVSKWERGLLAPDIMLLPRLAILYETSLDALFEMDALRGDVKREEFVSRLRDLSRAGDREGVYQLLLRQIELTPDDFTYYPDIFTEVRKMDTLDERRIARMLRLCEYVDRHCRDDRVRNEIHMHTAFICHRSTDPKMRKKALLYLDKLPLMRHNKETQAPHFLEGHEREQQLKWNVLRMIDVAECALRFLIREDMPPDEKLSYYRQGLALYNTVLGEGYGGFWDGPRLFDYRHIASICLAMGRREEAEEAVAAILHLLALHTLSPDERPVSPIVPDPAPEGYPGPDRILRIAVEDFLADGILAEYHEAIRRAYMRD